MAGALLLTSCSGGHTAAQAGPGAAGGGKHSAVPTTAPPLPTSYVALGDSYTAGIRIPDQIGTPAGCERSDHSYPALVAQDLHLTASHVQDVSCNGATTANLTAAQPTGDGTNPAQLSAISATTTIVTLGIGGNDVGFVPILTRCVEMDVLPALIDNGDKNLAPCRTYYTSGGVDQIQQKIQAAGDQLTGILAQIHQIAPHAHVYVVGYPDMLPSGGTACAHTVGLTQSDVTFVNGKEQQLNTMLNQEAQAEGATYVDTYTPSVGHDACTPESTRWVEPLLPDADAAPMHPNATGELAMAAAVDQAIAAVKRG
ncbi:MAG TPA: SGNH/GDSL hydrolase family protein [Actinocrinis sp.]|nr:SGNH/GDSL hydrolase family protein [Actinocrinis sp.]